MGSHTGRPTCDGVGYVTDDAAHEPLPAPVHQVSQMGSPSLGDPPEPSPSGTTDNGGSSRHTKEMGTLRHSDSIVIKRSQEELYDMVADVTRTGEWSPVCMACWWDEGEGPHVGAKFTGRNERPERAWETRSEVVTADRGRHSPGWWLSPRPASMGDPSVAVDGGTEVTETWELPPKGSAFFEKMFGDETAKEIAMRGQAGEWHRATLAAIKNVAEA